MAEPKAPPSIRSLVALITGAAGLVTAVGGLVTAVAAHRKQPEEPAAKESYLVVQKAIEEVSTDVDLARGEASTCRAETAALQAAFNDYVHAAAKQAAAPLVPTPTPAPRPAPSATAQAVPPEDGGAPEHDLRPSRAHKKASVRMPAYSDIENKARR